MSSSVSSMLDIALTVSSSLPTSRKVSSSSIFFANISCSRLIVCNGWRRSWLAAARNRDLPRLACSASRLAASNASVTCLRSVMSSIASRILRPPSDPSRIFAGVQQQKPPPEQREFDLDLVIFNRNRLLDLDPIEEAAQPWTSEVAISRRSPAVCRRFPRG